MWSVLFGTFSRFHMLWFLLSGIFVNVCMGRFNYTVRVVPRFTDLPPPVSYFADTSSVDLREPNQLDLVCRAWPPNAKLLLLAHHSSNSPECLSNPALCVDTGFPTLLPLPRGLDNQRYAILPASQITSSNGIASISDLIIHESLSEAIRERPAAAPNDEVAVKLSVTTMSEVRLLESVRLHCLVVTPFGQLLSPPFRVIPTSLGNFPARANEVDGSPRTVEYCTNNIAAVECQLPTNSHPTPLVSFELNDTVIGEASLQSDKYRVVWRPDGRSVSLLIHGVQFSDWGTYRCFFTNPLTGEKKYSPESTLIKLISPTSPVEHHVTVQLVPSSDSASGNLDRSQKIVVHEGQNVTLFCIIQGAPPPTVTTYPFAPNATDYNRFQTDRKFGLLQITNVQPRDAGFYICSYHRISSTAQLYVKPRLRLTTKPEDVRVTQLGSSVQFKCGTSDPSVAPVWLFNGQPQSRTGSTRGSNLELSNITSHHLGLYQCVASRTSDSQSSSSSTGNIPNVGTPDEWVSSFAVLSFDLDRVVRTAEELSEFVSYTANTQDTISEAITSELTPQAQVLYDNLAASVFWQPLRFEQSDLEKSRSIEYRLEYSVQITPAEAPSSDLSTNPDTMAALVGLVGHAAVRWSDPSLLKQQQTAMTFFYVTDDVLKPSKRYRFRVIAIDPSTGVNLAPPSGWSNVISTEHISPVEPPQIKTVRPLSQGRVHLVWTFDGAAGINAAAGRLLSADGSSMDALSRPFTINPISSLEPSSGLFVPDYFLLLARPLVKPKADSADSFKYGAYWSTQVNGSSAREGILSGLNRSSSYQVIVYAVRGVGDKRQITRFSKAAYVNLAVVDHAGTYSLWRALTANRLMYLILGGIAALMFIVVFIFILLCVCRQHRERRGHSQRKKQNGFVQGYKDKSQYIPVSTTDGNGGQPHSGAGTISNHGANSATTPMLMMSNLQCSAFSDHSASTQYHGQPTNPMLPHPNDQYSAAMVSEMMLMQQQQHQSMVGSQLHLQQDQQAGFHPQHHQSHHSLLLPPGTVLSQGPGGTVYQSGTLPGGGPRYVRQHQFGSQQPLNRVTSPANMVDIPDFYHTNQSNVYAHQQPQLPPVPHPQTSELPPMHVMSNGTQMHPQMVYYPGTVTPNGSSLKREPPTGGPLQDGTAYGTVLQRGQLTGSMINDRSSVGGGSMRPVSSHHPSLLYYPNGSQQALHMIQHPSGMGTPQAGMYSPRQQQAIFFAQQQHQYPGYFIQQLSQHPDALGHGPHHGYGHTDGESIYSYFSQQEMGQQPGSHQPLNPLPEENQMHPAGSSSYVESGMQTADGQGPGADDSPATAAGNHRHHRRRRRKQQRQLSDTPNGGAGSGGGGGNNDSGDPVDEGPPLSEQPGDAQLTDQRPMFEQEYAAQKRHRSISGTVGPYSDADPMSGQLGFGSPQSYPNQNGQSMNDSNRSGYTRYESPQRSQLSTGQLPPPNQPPPPPPPPGMANGFSHSDPHATSFPGGYPNPAGDSLSRRLYSGPSTGGLLVGPPPRMRDYSEYGIPRGIGLPPTPSGGQPLPSQHNVLMGSPMSPPPQANGSMLYSGRYREGQA